MKKNPNPNQRNFQNTFSIVGLKKTENMQVYKRIAHNYQI